jgi:phosphatidylglycerol:prolipoprotein diacylglycerol transferase
MVMHPYLFHLGPLAVSTYGVCLMVGLLLATAVVGRLATEAGLDRERMLILAWSTALVGMGGARLLYVCTRANYFLAHPLETLRFWDGWAFLGGPIAGTAFLAWFTWHFGIATWKVLDVMAASHTLALVCGRLGCFAAGCCHGRPTTCPLGVRFDSGRVDAACRGVSVHPTQLYEAAGVLLIFFGLLWVFQRRSFDGQVVLTYFLAYPVLRGFIELLRGDADRGYVVPGLLSTSQFLSVVLFVGALVAWRLRSRMCRSPS